VCFAADFAQKGLVLEPTTASATASPEVLAAQISYVTGMSADDRTLNGAAADVWSSGVVLYAMLTGEAPFKPLASESMYSDPNSRVQAYEDMLRGMRSWVSHQKPTDGSLCIPVCTCHPLKPPVPSLLHTRSLVCFVATCPHTIELSVRSENAAFYLAGWS